MDFAGAVEDAVDTCVAVIPLDRQFFAITHAAEDLHRAVHHAAEGFCGVHFDHGDLFTCVVALVEQPGSVVDHPAGGVDLDHAVGQHLLDKLEVSNFLAELLALASVVHHLFQHMAGFAHRTRADLREANDVQGTHGEFEALAFFA